MSTIRIVTDSTSDIPLEVAQALGVDVVPLKVIFGQDVYLDGVTIRASQFYELLQHSERFPTTSQPSPAEIYEVYERIFQETPDAQIISIHLSASLSGTYQSAVIARSMAEGKANQIHVYNSKSASYGFGMLVVRAAEMAKNGNTLEEIQAEIRKMNREKRLAFLVDTLEYLHKGGRIGTASSLIGSVLNIKPIFNVDDQGNVAVVEKVRGRKKAIKTIIDKMETDFGSNPVDLILGWTTDKETAMELGQLLQAHLTVKTVQYTWIGPVIGAHVGPGATAVFIHRTKG